VPEGDRNNLILHRRERRENAKFCSGPAPIYVVGLFGVNRRISAAKPVAFPIFYCQSI
jgi:hypothetical protein